MSTPNQAPSQPPQPLPTLSVRCDAPQVGTRLDALSKRGKLPDYRREGSGFRVKAFGNQMDMTLVGTISTTAEGSEIRFTLEREWKLIWIYAAITVLTMWPGLALTDSMISTYFTGYDFDTWKWYVPLIVVPTPILGWFEVRKSQRMARESAAELIERMRVTLA